VITMLRAEFIKDGEIIELVVISIEVWLMRGIIDAASLCQKLNQRCLPSVSLPMNIDLLLFELSRYSNILIDPFDNVTSSF